MKRLTSLAIATVAFAIAHIGAAPAATTATLRFTRPTTTATCDYLVYTGTGLPPSTLQSAEPTVTNAAGGREIELALTGLTTATAYGVRVTCSSARGYINFSTN